MSTPDYGVFAHLNAEKAPLYRALLDTLVAERARFALALRPGELHAALLASSAPGNAGLPPGSVSVVSAGFASSVSLPEIEAALRQLHTWGNLDDAPDTAEAATIEEFYRNRRLYQLSASGEAAEHALAAFHEHLRRPGELQTTALHDIIDLLDALLPLLADSPPDDAKIHLTLSSLADRFKQLATRAESFMRGLQRTVELHGLSVADFLAYKEKLIDYLEHFIGELVVATHRIAQALVNLEQCGITLAFAAAARRETADLLNPPPDALPSAESAWQARWLGLRRWFIGGATPSHAEHLRARARSAIPSLLTAVNRLNERRASRTDRAADFSTLARWFAETPDEASAHRLWRAAFALTPARHLRLNSETLAARTDDSPRASWLHAEPMWLSPRLRQTGRTVTRGTPPAAIDRTAEKQQLAAIAAEETRQLELARSALLHSRRRLSQLPPLDPVAFRLFLDLLGQALCARHSTDATVLIDSADGSLRLRLEPVPDAPWISLPVATGTIHGPDHWLTITSSVSKIP